MPGFGAKSTIVLDTLHPDLQLVCNTVIDRVDFSLIHGYRNKALQNSLYRSGKSQLKWPDSKHNTYPSEAFDFISYPFYGWDKHFDFVYRAGIFIATGWNLGIKLRWGGDWDRDFTTVDTNFLDLGHIELIKKE